MPEPASRLLPAQLEHFASLSHPAARLAVVPSSRHEAVTAESDVTVYAFQGCGMDWAAGGRLLTFVDAGKGSRDQGDGYVVSG